MTDVPSRQRTLATPGSSARCRLGRSIPTQGPASPHSVSRSAERIAANSPSAVQAVKRQVTATIADHVLAHEAQEQELGDKVRASLHFAEGIAAFREKRQPRYE